MVSVAIVGAGFSGLGMAIKLQQAGFTDFTIFEAADDIGGTWRANRYPGCACDVQSVLYCFSFEPYPWTQHYSEQQEILQYLHHCADKYGLWDHIQLNSRVTGAVWDEMAAVWRVSAALGEEVEAQVLVLAQGPLSVPIIPSLPGLPLFKGSVLHTAAWDSSVELQGKKVAVVGTGASAIQVIPRLQQVARELVVFQRTPPWVLPRKELMPRYAVPAAQHGHRLTLWLQRQAVFWRNELLVGTALVNNRQGLLRKIEALATRHMQSAVSDPALRSALTPDYSIGCKRILASDDYYPALAAPNVTLVASGLQQVMEDGTSLQAANGDVITDVDVIVFATGFDLHAPLGQFSITARGLDLAQTLAVKPEAYYGTAVAGFPNLFTMLGLNSGLGHSSVVFMAECQINLILQLIKGHLQHPGSWVEVSPTAQAAVNSRIQRRLQNTVWLSGCKSWYLTTGADTHATPGSNGSSTEGPAAAADGSSEVAAAARDSSSGRRNGGIVLWPGLCVEFWWRTLRPVDRDWLVGRATAAAGKAAAGGAAAAVAATATAAGSTKEVAGAAGNGTAG